MTIAPGTKLGRYEIRSKIGEGGMGEVYRARDEKLNRDVAIKVLPAGLSQDGDRLGRFEQEAQAAGALNHPNILAIYDVATHDGFPYVVSELLEGETLRQRMSGTALPQRKAIDYALQIAHGLGHPRFSPKGNMIAFLDHSARYDDRGSVMTVDLAGNKNTLSSGWVSLYGLAWNPSGDEIWFTGSEEGVNNSLQAVALSGRHRAVAKGPGRMELQDISRAGRVLIKQVNIRVGIIGLAPGETKEHDLSLFDASVAKDISVDGRTLLFMEAGVGGGAYGAVYLRKMDGSPAVRLGDGWAIGLSPDGKWVLASPHRTTLPQLALYPTGAGQLTLLPSGGINYHEMGCWFPDSRHILVIGDEPGHKPRCYIQGINGDTPRPVTPEGITAAGVTTTDMLYNDMISPDGNQIIAGPNPRELAFYPVSGGEPRPIRGLEAGDLPISWSADGRSLYVFRFGDVPAKVYRIDLQTGHKEFWKELMPSDPTGVFSIQTIVMTPDAKSYAYTYWRFLSELYMVEGAK